MLKNISYICFIFWFLISSFFCQRKNSYTITRNKGVITIKNNGFGLYEDSKKIILNKIAEFGTNINQPESQLFIVGDIEVDQEGNIYIIDLYDNCIKVYNKYGIFLRKIGKEGQGPGELIRPMYINIDSNNHILIYSAAEKKISLFDTFGVFIKSYKIYPNIYRSMCLTNDDKILLSRWSLPKQSEVDTINAIYKFDNNGNLIKEFHSLNSIGETTFGFNFPVVKVVCFKDGNYIIFPSYPYKIYFLNQNDILQRIITNKCEIFSIPKVVTVNNNELLVLRSNIQDIYPIPENKFLVAIIDNGQQYTNEIIKRDKLRHEGKFYKLTQTYFYDLYNSEGMFLQRFNLNDDFGIIIHVDHDGNVYTKIENEENVRVVKYSFSIEDK